MPHDMPANESNCIDYDTTPHIAPLIPLETLTPIYGTMRHAINSSALRNIRYLIVSNK